MTSLTKIKIRQSENTKESRNLEIRIGNLSENIWPWPESRLFLLVGVLGTLDYISTYCFLQINGDKTCETGLLASWALATGGFLLLFIIDLVSILFLITIAIIIKRVCQNSRFFGLSRTASILLLIPYATVTALAVCNNFVITFL